jgi:hypothetical protein
VRKLQALADYLIAANKVAKPEQLRGVMESGNPTPSFSQAGPDLLLFRHKYTARIVLEKFPHDLSHVLALTLAWLGEFAEDGDELLGWVGEPVDDRLGDVDLRLQFDEEARYVPKPTGYTGRDVVRWKGNDYVPGENAADLAESVELEGTVE